MAVIYKVYSLLSEPGNKKSPKRYYPKAITLGRSVRLNYITEKIKDQSSLSAGDVKSVLQNFIEKLKEQLLEGKSVNIEGLGCFRLSLKSKGAEKPDEVNAKTVESVRICFKAHKDLRINKTETRASDQLSLISIDDYLRPTGGDEDELEGEDGVVLPENPTVEGDGTGKDDDEF